MWIFLIFKSDSKNETLLHTNEQQLNDRQPHSNFFYLISESFFNRLGLGTSGF